MSPVFNAGLLLYGFWDSVLWYAKIRRNEIALDGGTKNEK